MRKPKIDRQNVLKIEDLKDQIIIAVSDVHLGYGDEETPDGPHCNKSMFNQFLEQLGGNIPCDRLVVCGDFLDLWRRDLLGVVLENQDTLNLLQEAVTNSKYTLHFVVGNHDYYLRRFRWNIDPSPNDLLFITNLKLVDQNDLDWQCSFLHGDEFDSIQPDMFYDALCMSNDASGSFMEDIWQFFRSTTQWYKRILAFLRSGKYEILTKTSLIPAEKRLTKAILGDIDKRAATFASKQNTTLVFGYTHTPFLLHEESILANTGSWVTDKHNDKPTNSYVRIKDGEIALLTFSDGESKLLRKETFP